MLIRLAGDCFAGKKGDKYDTITSDNESDSGDSDDELYTWPPEESSFVGKLSS